MRCSPARRWSRPARGPASGRTRPRRTGPPGRSRAAGPSDPAGRSRSAVPSRMTGIGHRSPRASTSTTSTPSSASRSELTAGRSPAAHARWPPRRGARHRTPGRRPLVLRPRRDRGRQRQRHPHVSVRQHAHRRKHVAGLERGSGAGRPGRHREAAPVELVDQRLAVDEQARERHDVRQPVDRVAHDHRVRNAGRRRPDLVDEPARADRLVGAVRGRRGHASAAASTRRHHRLRVGPSELDLAHALPGVASASAPARRAPRRRPARPTTGRRRRARRRPPAPRRVPARPARRRRAVRRRARQASHAAASGCRVPTSPFALCSAATTVPGSATATCHAASRSTRPDESTGTSSSSCGDVGARRHARDAGTSTAECSTARGDRPRAAPAAAHTGCPSTARRQRDRTARQEADLRRPYPEPRRDRLARRRRASRRAWRPSA